VFAEVVKEPFFSSSTPMSAWPFWAVFFVISLATIGLAKRLDARPNGREEDITPASDEGSGGELPA
jgi:hypothetical protein